jgi:hypothetical protein
MLFKIVYDIEKVFLLEIEEGSEEPRSEDYSE